MPNMKNTERFVRAWPTWMKSEQRNPFTSSRFTAIPHIHSYIRQKAHYLWIETKEEKAQIVEREMIVKLAS
ncbi:predicted protein [Sclerotinia sclerotiorum 1980 UF-70]|uniref:Uncharacterized protein n=1 Tax=Sclerotinia sclerotiorum (strain ATCC 18683 / 1980 / Ss-1) TaxID=665079 RepID=A7F4Q6_SCLS1|nr:predicted protein [Sclerotinia sclerotiorum 1980 UF-70]EDN97727.1 predicted protein [Sclerotinia sclerotiorum 1980 UF-70]